MPPYLSLCSINNAWKKTTPPQYALEALVGWTRAAFPTSKCVQGHGVWFRREGGLTNVTGVCGCVGRGHGGAPNTPVANQPPPLPRRRRHRVLLLGLLPTTYVPGPELAGHNALYSALAARQGAQYVGCGKGLNPNDGSLMGDGLHLTVKGQDILLRCLRKAAFGY